MKKKLTDKEEKYSQLVVKLGNKTEALKQSYDCSNMTDKTITEKASRLSKKHNVSTRIEELREEGKERNKIDIDFITQGLLKIINDVDYTIDLAKLKSEDKAEVKKFYMMKEVNTGTDKLRAYDMLIKMYGLNTPDKIEQDIRIEIVEKKRDA